MIPAEPKSMVLFTGGSPDSLVSVQKDRIFEKVIAIKKKTCNASKEILLGPGHGILHAERWQQDLLEFLKDISPLTEKGWN